MNKVANKFRLLSDKDTREINDEYFLVKSDNRDYYLYRGKDKCEGLYDYCTKYKDVAVLVRADSDAFFEYVVITNKGMTTNIDDRTVVDILKEEINFSELVLESLKYENDLYFVDNEILNNVSKGNLISVIVRGKFVVVGISLETFFDCKLIYNKDGEKLVDYDERTCVGVEHFYDKLILELNDWKVYDEASENKHWTSGVSVKEFKGDKPSAPVIKVLIDSKGNVLRGFNTRHTKGLNNVVIVQGKEIISLDSMQSIHKDIIKREFERCKNPVAVRELSNNIGIICERGKLGGLRIEDCSIINFVTNEVYENVTVYNYRQEYSAIVIDLKTSIKVINTHNGETHTIEGTLERVYKDMNNTGIIRLADGTRYRLDTMCSISLYNYREN